MHPFSPYFAAYPPLTPTLGAAFIAFFALALLWTIVLKGFALWYAARNSQKWWFGFILVTNTLGILELIYLIWFRPKSDTSSASSSADESSAQA